MFQIGVGFADVLMDWMTPNVAKVDDKDDLFTKHSSKLTAQQQKFYLSQRTDFENMEINDKRRSQYTQNKNFPIFKVSKIVRKLIFACIFISNVELPVCYFSAVL